MGRFSTGVVSLRPLHHGSRSAVLIAAILSGVGFGVLAAPVRSEAQTPTPTPHCAAQAGSVAWLSLPACAAPSVSSTPVTFDCNQLDGHLTFQSNQIVYINGDSTGHCRMSAKTIAAGLHDIIIIGVGRHGHPNDHVPIVINHDLSDSSETAFDIHGSNILISDINFGTSFQQPIVVEADASNVSLENISISNPQLAGFTIKGANTCLRGTAVIHSGGNGYDVKTSASGTLDFRAAAAMNSAQDGFAIEHDSGISRAQFLNCTSVKNGGDGYDVAGPRVDVLCSESFQN